MGVLGERKPNIQSLTRATDVDALIKAAYYTDLQAVEDGTVHDLGTAVRADAVLALGSLGPDVGAQAVSSALQDPADNVRCAAVLVLHRRKVTDPLVDALSRLPAADGRSLELARRALTSLSGAVDSAAAVRALVHTQDERLLESEDISLVDALLDGETSERRTEVIEFLVGALVDDRGIVADRAAELLVALSPHSTAALVEELRSGDAPAEAAWILGKIADARTVDALIEALSHDESSVRAESAAALAEIGDPLAVAPLVHATRDSDQVVRTQSRMALDEFGTIAVIVGVAELLRPVVLEAGRSTRSGSGTKAGRRVDAPKKNPTRRAASAKVREQEAAPTPKAEAAPPTPRAEPEEVVPPPPAEPGRPARSNGTTQPQGRAVSPRNGRDPEEPAVRQSQEIRPNGAGSATPGGDQT